MKKQIVLLTTVFFAAIFTLFSCQSDDNLPVLKTKTQLLTQGPWKYSSAVRDGVNLDPFLLPCQKDNTTTLAAAGTGTTDEGPLKCNPADPQSNSFTWTFQSGETMLSTSAALIPGGTTTSTIVTLSETQLVLSQPYVLAGVTKDAVVTFVH